ncbi:hypothetical protein GJU39_18280 [Pedobacter petrophilus]|uniref:Uncharacterized protein n=1 Tax=Pedobacter petrophilus TaxID=1908241 RepID=A0A7K0G2W0_9SPHI|nr:hypothetical protein [Pedobacter petrophilus]MRX78031.1 hypothetical protein [Pedobacter petrophilus]
MEKKIILFIAFAVLHLSIVLLNALGINSLTQKTLNKLYLTYCTLSGTDTKYGYFSPNISDDFDVVYTLYKREMVDRKFRLKMKNEECRQRLYTMYNYFYRIEESRDLMARSLAFGVLKNYPDCSKIKIELFLYQLPTTRQYQNKAKAYWELFYSTEFELN